MIHKVPIVLILTGPCGVGKTTVSQRLAQSLGMLRISGDEIKDRLFPQIGDITQFPDKLQQVKQQLLLESKDQFAQGKSIVVDYVVLGKPFISQFRTSFGSHLMIKVLFPSYSVIYKRDLQRSCWTSGKACIDGLVLKFEALRDFIGAEHFLDNGGETVEETVVRLQHFIHFHVAQILQSPL